MRALGIDAGTHSVKAVLLDEGGQVLAFEEEKLPPPLSPIEQDPRTWVAAAQAAVRRALSAAHPCLTGTGAPGSREPLAVAVTSTSGTVVAVGEDGSPLGPALMYNDPRSAAEAAEVEAVHRAASGPGASAGHLGVRFGASFGLPKVLWWLRHQPAAEGRAARFLHAGDFLAAALLGNGSAAVPDVATDWTSAFKSGYDVVHLHWPEWIERELGLSFGRLPRVVAPGTQIGAVSAAAAEAWDLPAGTPVYAGLTDGCAAQIAAGAAQPGDWSTTIGSTLILKGIAQERLVDPAGMIYSHRHPEGWWMPGAAGNTGAAILRQRYGADLAAWDARAEAFLPTPVLAYPNAVSGERFPFIHPAASAFVDGHPAANAEEYAAFLQGLALIERLAYATVQRLGAPVHGPIVSTGGGARSRVWAQVRADVLQRPIVRPELPEPAVGAALVALSGANGQPLSAVTRRAVRHVPLAEPRPALAARYDEIYGRFLQALAARGYLAISGSEGGWVKPT